MPGAPAGQDSRPRLRSISCTGSEASWEACKGASWANTPCDPQGEAGISCTGAARELGGCLCCVWLLPWGFPSSALTPLCFTARCGRVPLPWGSGQANLPMLSSSPPSSALTPDRHTATIRLVSAGAPAGSRVMQGRLELQLANGTWSTVCDDSFSDASASVACRQARGGASGEQEQLAAHRVSGQQYAIPPHPTTHRLRCCWLFLASAPFPGCVAAGPQHHWLRCAWRSAWAGDGAHRLGWSCMQGH